MTSTFNNLPSLLSLPGLCNISAAQYTESATIYPAEPIGTTSEGNAEAQLMPLAWVARLGEISDDSHLYGLRRDAGRLLGDYFGSTQPTPAPTLARGIERLFSSARGSDRRKIPHRIDDAPVPRLRPWKAGERVLGMGCDAWMGEIVEHREELAEHGAIALLNRAKRADQIHFVHPMWLTFSPFGINSDAFCCLGTRESYAHATPIAPLIGDGLRVGSFGAGLHDEAAYLETMARRALRNHSSSHLFGPAASPELWFAFRLKEVQEGLFGPTAAASYEAREMLALWFRDGERDGEIHVFDRDPNVARSLLHPRFAITNALSDTLRNLFPGSDTLPARLRHYFNILAGGRSVEMKRHGVMPNGDELRTWSFELTDRELSKIHSHEVDMVTDPLPDLERFDLSVWLNSHYFFSPTVALLTFAKILHQTKVGGYLLTDYLVDKRIKSPGTRRMMHALGIAPVAAHRNSFVGGAITSQLIQKRADSEAVTLLASLLNG